jgi:hypothetical protein
VSNSSDSYQLWNAFDQCELVYGKNSPFCDVKLKYVLILNKKKLLFYLLKSIRVKFGMLIISAK